MPEFVDITGHRYGRLMAVQHIGRVAHGKHAWRCVCDCGSEVERTSNVMRRGTTRSCGCLGREVAAENGRRVGPTVGARNGKASAKHGHTKAGNLRTPTYRSWQSMKDRCDNPPPRSVKAYAGVTICERWRDFRNFFADMGERPVGMTLDRENPFGNYEPGNCRWATRSTQSKNTRANWLKTHAPPSAGATA